MRKPGIAGVAGAAVTALLAAGCGGGSAPVAGDAAATAGVPASASPTAGATAGAHVRGHASHPGKDAGPSASAPRTAAAGTGRHGGTTSGGGSDASADDSGATGGAGGGELAPLTPAGRYRYHVAGSASSALGRRTFDGTSTLTVDPPSRHRQHSATQGDEGSSEQTVLARPDGLYLLDIRISQQGFSEDFRPQGSALLLPSDAAAGDEWRWRMTSTDGDYSLRATLRLADDSASAQVGGRRVPTTVVTAVIVITGNGLSLTTHQRDEATRDGLIVHEHTVGDGTAYGTKVHSDTTRTLQS